MKIRCLLIGFEYIRNRDWDSLPGISVDLYQAYMHCLQITEPENITVFTDINRDHHINILKRSILNGNVGAGLLSFIADLKSRNQHQLFSSGKKHKYNINNFEPVVKTATQKCQRLVLYYSGHARNGHIILPDDTHVPLSHLYSIISSDISSVISSDNNKKERIEEIISIFDCCESNGMNLPYIYDGWSRLVNTEFVPGRIICLSSSKIDQDSRATKTGSPFTQTLFKYFTEKDNYVISLKELVEDMIERFPINISCSYPERILFSWFPKKNPNNITLELDQDSNIIKIQLNNSGTTIGESKTIEDYIRYLSELDYNDVNK